MVENDQPAAVEALKKLYSKTGHSYIIGITGPPGSGKSTLTDKITQTLTQRGNSVGIIAVDPSSPFHGGALLGDRLRMQKSIKDGTVFFRSMATRGAMGGLSKATTGAILLIDAFGKDFILLETVGVGQDELDIVKTADSTILISIPGMGDEIQTLKAGIMEIGDIYVVNKSDREGAGRLVSELTLLKALSESNNSWNKPIIKTIAINNDGVDNLVDKILEHRKYLEGCKKLQNIRIKRIEKNVMNMIEWEIHKTLKALIKENDANDEIIKKIFNREKNPYSYVEEIVEPFKAYCSNYIKK